MITSKHYFLWTLIFPILLFPQNENTPRLKILHPRQDMQFWVNKIEIAGDIPPGTQVLISGEEVFPDENGRFRYMFPLNQSSVLIPIEETRGSLVFTDTLRVFHRTPDRMSPDSTFVNNNIPEELDIHIRGPRGGSFYRPVTNIYGRTHPNATLKLNGDTLLVYGSGAFTQFVQIQPGRNQFILESTHNGDNVSDTLVLTRFLPDLNSWIPESAKPNSERWIMGGEHLQVGIHGPPERHVQYKIPGISGWINLPEIAPGNYAASHHLIDIDEEITTRVLYRSGIFSKRMSSSPLKIITDALGGFSIHEDTRVYDTANDENLLFPLADSISLQISGLENRMYQIKLGRYRTAYVKADRVAIDPGKKLTSPHFLGRMAAENNSDWSIFKIHTGSIRLPFEIKEKAVPGRLELSVYGAKQGWEWSIYPEDDSAINIVERSQPHDLVWQMDFYPKQKFWGWFGRYEGEYLVIGIRKAPMVDQDSLFANIRIEIDPGHGGWQRGAVGSTGYAEADANLRYSLKLAKMLRDAGATVFMTRLDDRQLSLAKRAEIARNDSVHIFVMAHNNAPGSRSNFLEAKGASTFYTWPSSKPLSDKLYPYMGNMGIDTSGKVVRYYYYLTRQTEYLVYLVEGAFMTNPEEEMFLLSEEGLESLANAAFLGLEDFLSENATN